MGKIQKKKIITKILPNEYNASFRWDFFKSLSLLCQAYTAVWSSCLEKGIIQENQLVFLRLFQSNPVSTQKHQLLWCPVGEHRDAQQGCQKPKPTLWNVWPQRDVFLKSDVSWLIQITMAMVRNLPELRESFSCSVTGDNKSLIGLLMIFTLLFEFYSWAAGSSFSACLFSVRPAGQPFPESCECKWLRLGQLRYLMSFLPGGWFCLRFHRASKFIFVNKQGHSSISHLCESKLGRPLNLCTIDLLKVAVLGGWWKCSQVSQRKRKFAFTSDHACLLQIRKAVGQWMNVYQLEDCVPRFFSKGKGTCLELLGFGNT